MKKEIIVSVVVGIIGAAILALLVIGAPNLFVN
jgi:hypothetical protein